MRRADVASDATIASGCCIRRIIVMTNVASDASSADERTRETTSEPGNRATKTPESTNEPNAWRTNPTPVNLLRLQGFLPFGPRFGEFRPEARPDCRTDPGGAGQGRWYRV